MTTLTNNPYIDELTGLNNFMKFFTDDFDQVYGTHGHILYVKIKGLKSLNEVHGFDIGDEVLKVIASYLKANMLQIYYRNEGNAFTVIYNGQGVDYAIPFTNTIYRGLLSIIL